MPNHPKRNIKARLERKLAAALEGYHTTDSPLWRTRYRNTCHILKRQIKACEAGRKPGAWGEFKLSDDERLE